MNRQTTRRIGIAPCVIDGCDGVMFSRGWCARHYTRWSRHGDPLGGRLDTLEDRFWTKVEKAGADECWEWIAARNDDGYGLIRGGVKRSMERAHRVSWRLAHGQIPNDLQVLHRCDNPPCVNPAHLFLGTQEDNNKDAARKGRTSRGERHWMKNHEGRAFGGKQGEANRKLTEAQVREIRSRYASGDDSRDIATDFGIERSTVYSIHHRKTWKHVA